MGVSVHEWGFVFVYGCACDVCVCVSVGECRWL